MKTYSIYRITNTINGKSYIGLTTMPIALRWQYHVTAAQRAPEKQPVSRAIAKYGAEAFLIEHIACCRDAADMHATEISIIAQEQTCDPRRGYNVSAGGASGGYGTVRSETFKRNLSAKMTGNRNALGAIRSAETREKMSRSQKGHAVSPEQRANIAATLRNNPEVIARLRAYNERFTGSKQLKMSFSP